MIILMANEKAENRVLHDKRKIFGFLSARLLLFILLCDSLSLKTFLDYHCKGKLSIKVCFYYLGSNRKYSSNRIKQ